MISRLCAVFVIVLLIGGAGWSLAEAIPPDQTIPAVSQSVETATPIVEMIQPGEKLTLDRVVDIARQRQPTLAAAQGSITVNQSKVGQAEAGYYPQVDAAASYNRLSPGATSSFGVISSSQNQYVAGLTVKQRLYDFGKTSTQVDIQRTTLDSSRSDLAAVEEQVLFTVKLAYYDMLKAGRNIEVATETVKQFGQHLEQAKGFFEAGLKPKYDVTKAEVDLSNAKLNLIRMKNGLSLARVVLNNAMGIPEAPDYEIVDTLRFSPLQLSFDKALAMAFDHRPDLKALLLKKRAAEQGVSLAQKGDSPYVSGNASTSYNAEKLAMDPGWSVGVALSVPVFNGYQTRYQISEAQANVDILSARETSLRQSIHKDVQQGFLNLQEAEERISATKFAVQQAEENFEIASGRYEAGVGAPVEITDAYVLLINARTNHIQALYDYRITQTMIEQAVGVSGMGEK